MLVCNLKISLASPFTLLNINEASCVNDSIVCPAPRHLVVSYLLMKTLSLSLLASQCEGRRVESNVCFHQLRKHTHSSETQIFVKQQQG